MCVCLAVVGAVWLASAGFIILCTLAAWVVGILSEVFQPGPVLPADPLGERILPVWVTYFVLACAATVVALIGLAFAKLRARVCVRRTPLVDSSGGVGYGTV